MPEAEPRPWFSWAPNMPKPAILAMALLCNLNILGFGYGGALNEINAALATFATARPAEFSPTAGRLLETPLQAELTQLAEGPIARFTKDSP